MSDAATLAFYEANAARYSHDLRPEPSRYLDTFLDRLNPGVRVLELGCGGGRDAAYDAIWAHACLIHVPRAEFARVLAATRRALRPGGWHFANYKLGDGEGRDPLGRLTNFPDETWLGDAYGTAGFAIVETERYRGEGADGVVRDWYALTVRRD